MSPDKMKEIFRFSQDFCPLFDRNWNISQKTVLRLKKLRLFFQNGFEPIVKIVWTMKRFLLQHMSNMTVENCRTCSSVSHFVVRLSSLSTMVFCYQNCSYLLWEKILLVIEKNFWNSRLKAENLEKFWDH